MDQNTYDQFKLRVPKQQIICANCKNVIDGPICKNCYKNPPISMGELPRDGNGNIYPNLYENDNGRRKQEDDNNF